MVLMLLLPVHKGKKHLYSTFLHMYIYMYITSACKIGIEKLKYTHLYIFHLLLDLL